MEVMKDDSNHTNEQGEVPLHPSIDLTGGEHNSVGVGHTMPDVLFTLQEKAFIMSFFGIEVPSASNSTPSHHTGDDSSANNPDLYAKKSASYDE